MRSKALKDRLLKRDGGLCGVHVGGCGEPLTLADATVDHIIPRNIWETAPEVFDRLAQEYREGFLQLMHSDCNNSRKRGQLHLNFGCECHGSLTTRANGNVKLEVSYTDGWLDGCSVHLATEEFGGFLFAIGKTRDGSTGYKRNSYGGCFESPFKGGPDNLVLSGVTPVAVVAFPLYQSTEDGDLRPISIETHRERMDGIRTRMAAFQADMAMIQTGMSAMHTEITRRQAEITNMMTFLGQEGAATMRKVATVLTQPLAFGGFLNWSNSLPAEENLARLGFGAGD